MDEEQMDALVASIRELGFISVLVVVRVGERYEVVAGHRRRIAAGRAGLVAVPCLIYPSKGAAMEAIQHAENKHREELNRPTRRSGLRSCWKRTRKKARTAWPRASASRAPTSRGCSRC
jgi:ParB/RepB/Spo0J family partition protein